MPSLLSRVVSLLGFRRRQFLLAAGDGNAEQSPWGGQLTPPPQTQTRWYMADLEVAERAADVGDLSIAARIMRSAQRDGVYGGVLSTRTGGLVRLPRRFRGHPDVIEALEPGHDSAISVFDEMFPASELALLAKDGIELGVAVGELVSYPDREYPILVRREPEYLKFNWSENTWYYRSIIGLLPITPGDGRWILHTPGGRSAPWQNGKWKAVAKAFIRKDHAEQAKDAWEATLANPARILRNPSGATEVQRQTWLQKIAQWGRNTVYGLPPGYDLALLESNGKGADSFRGTIQDQNQELIICVAGQTVTTDGGAGFQNSDIHRSIRGDLIKETADSLAYTLNTQGLPIFVLSRWGVEALATHAVVMEWDVTPPRDRTAEASAMNQWSQALKGMTEALAPYGYQPDVAALAVQFGVPVKLVAATAPARALPAELPS